MKWSIFGLLFFGVIAAVCAALLVIHLETKGKPRVGSGEVELLVAARPIEPGTLLKTEDIVKKPVPRKDMPETYFTNPIQLIGKVPVARMPKDAIFTRAHLASEGAGYRVASVLENGMRAVTISLNDSAGLSGIIYAGSFVDVLTTFATRRGRGEAITFPLLENINVLAVEGETVVSDPKAAAPAKKTRESSGRKLLVTLMVDMKQAAALQIAEKYGTVSLALRNPMDTTPSRKDKMFLSKLLAEMPSIAALISEGGTDDTDDPDTAGEKKAAASVVSIGAGVYDVTILRGPKSETKHFPLDVQGESDNQGKNEGARGE
jgi:pilus assembly protein CpaB